MNNMKFTMDDSGKATPLARVKPVARYRKGFALTLQLLLLGLLTWKTASIFRSSLGFEQDVKITEEWRWSQIASTKDLIWHPCFDKYDCAKLDVPLDWLNPSEDLRAAIAIIRLNATEKSNYKGPVFINPGGPGGSGIWFVKRLGLYYQTVVGRNHDIISFDPRGVGATVPHISCWENTQSSQIWDLREVDVVDAHIGAVSDSFARSTAFSRQCASAIGGGNDSQSRAAGPIDRGILEAGPGKYVSTASTARDMLEIMEKSGEKRLQYWGFSYGTVLGIVFASMFPDKVGRMVNDGNVDVDEYMSGTAIHFIQDADKVMDAFYQFCYLAGPDDCAFYEGSPREIENRFDKLLDTIKKEPVIVSAPSSGRMPDIISYSDVRRMQSRALYRPLLMFPPFAKALAGLEQRDGMDFIQLLGPQFQDMFKCETPDLPPPEDPELEATADASSAILCSDGDMTYDTVDTLQEYVNMLLGMSKAAGAAMANFKLSCVGWSVEAKWRYTGPFTGNTSSPILFISNSADNVTPLRSAIQNAKGFPDSVILVQNSYGHTSLSAPSRCTARAVQAYFQNGTIPVNGTVCEADLVPFEKFELPSPKEGIVGFNNFDEDLDLALLHLVLAPSIPASF